MCVFTVYASWQVRIVGLDDKILVAVSEQQELEVGGWWAYSSTKVIIHKSCSTLGEWCLIQNQCQRVVLPSQCGLVGNIAILISQGISGMGLVWVRPLWRIVPGQKTVNTSFMCLWTLLVMSQMARLCQASMQ